MDLSIAIVSWNTKDILDQCLNSINETASGVEFEVIVVDNASSDGSAEMVAQKYPCAQIIQNEDNVGFPKANNQAYAISKGRHFLLLNPDTIMRGDTLKRLVKHLDSNPNAGAVGPLVLNTDGTLQYSWARFPTFWSELRGVLDRRIPNETVTPTTAEQTRDIGPFEVDWIGGCAMMVRRDAIEQIGMMDESFFMYNEETDWCYRLRRSGWQVWVDPAGEITHLGGQSSEQVSLQSAKHLRTSKRLYFAKHYSPWVGDILYAALTCKVAVLRLSNRR